MSDRFRLVYGETHDSVRIADDEKREYIWGLPVSLLNEQDHKIRVMEDKLNKLGFELWFLENCDGEDSTGISLTRTPGEDSMGEWVVLSEGEVKKYTS